MCRGAIGPLELNTWVPTWHCWRTSSRWWSTMPGPMREREWVWRVVAAGAGPSSSLVYHWVKFILVKGEDETHPPPKRAFDLAICFAWHIFPLDWWLNFAEHQHHFFPWGSHHANSLFGPSASQPGLWVNFSRTRRSWPWSLPWSLPPWSKSPGTSKFLLILHLQAHSTAHSRKWHVERHQVNRERNLLSIWFINSNCNN